MFKKSLVTIAALTFALSAPSSHALGKKKQVQPDEAKPAPAETGPSIDELKTIFAQATSEVENAEALVKSGDYGKALLAARSIFDRTSVINPKANYRPKITVAGVLTDSDLTKTFSELTNHQKDEIARAVGGYKDGYYLDLLNLAKRSKLIYLQAFYQTTKSKFYDRDIEKLKTDLLEMHDIAILIQDNKASDALMIFDSDVANPDQQYFFDRELLDFATTVPELKLDETQFTQLLEKNRKDQLQSYHAGLTRNTTSYSDPKFLECRDLFTRIGSMKLGVASDLCHQKPYADYTFINEHFSEFDGCLESQASKRAPYGVESEVEHPSGTRYVYDNSEKAQVGFLEDVRECMKQIPYNS